jgi:hypothetical protein
MEQKVRDQIKALEQTLEFLEGQIGKSHGGYFGPGGWAYERLKELQAELARKAK